MTFIGPILHGEIAFVARDAGSNTSHSPLSLNVVLTNSGLISLKAMSEDSIAGSVSESSARSAVRLQSRTWQSD